MSNLEKSVKEVLELIQKRDEMKKECSSLLDEKNKLCSELGKLSDDINHLIEKKARTVHGVRTAEERAKETIKACDEQIKKSKRELVDILKENEDSILADVISKNNTLRELSLACEHAEEQRKDIMRELDNIKKRIS